MDDLQLNISVPKRVKSKKSIVLQDNVDGYKFVSNPKLVGKTLARKRPKHLQKHDIKLDGEPIAKAFKSEIQNLCKEDDMSKNLRDLSENKGKYEGKSYQDLSDDIKLKQKPRAGGWISSLFKNNPGVPRIGQKAVKPLVEKVFTGETFNDLDIHPHSVANLQQNLSLTKLMTVQQKAIPVILQGRDVLIRSQTGSGKTLAYALPIIEALQAIRPKINRHDGIRVIVVVPTRELAVQTYELFIKLVKPFTWIVPGLLSGGQKRKAEKARLRKGLSILVGTPGRINDHLRHTKSLNFSKTGCLILDEADRLLDMGYEKDVAAIVKSIEDYKKAATYDPMAIMKQSVKKKISSDDEGEERDDATENETESTIKHNLTKVFLSKERQTILLSATLTKAVENLAGITMMDPVFVDTSEGRAIVADSVKTTSQIKSNVTDKVSESRTAQAASTEISDTKTNELTSNDKVSDSDTENRRGLKAFNGLVNKDLFSNGEVTKQLDENKSVTVHSESDDTDSDSDYEYFKVQKELEKKASKKGNAVAQLVITPSETGNTFEDAVKTAIIEDELVLPDTVHQTFIVVPMKLRLVTLCGLILEHCILNKKGGKMIVFMATLEMVDYHSDLIDYALTGKDIKAKMRQDRNKQEGGSSDEEKSEDSDFKVDYEIPSDGGLAPVEVDIFKLHGSMPHEQRIDVFQRFRTAKRGVLICTDVAARGIDVPRVDLVLQYCAPASATDYVHRVGRTGRAAQVGSAILFLLPSEVEFVRYLEKKRIRLRQSNESEPLEALRSVAPAASSATRAAVAVQAKLEMTANKDKEWLARASRAYTSWVRFYAGYPREVREWLDSKQLHLGHAAKAFALRDTPGSLARRAKSDPKFKKVKPSNKLTVHEDEEKKRPGFPKVKGVGSMGSRPQNKQTSMHTASEFDSGLPPLSRDKTHKNKNKK